MVVEIFINCCFDVDELLKEINNYKFDFFNPHHLHTLPPTNPYKLC